MPAGATGDLTEFRRGQLPMLPPVEFSIRGEGDVIDIEIETHADGVGGDEIIDFAVLIEIDLGVARTRRQGAENDGGAATLTPDPFGNGIDLFDRKGDD